MDIDSVQLLQFNYIKSPIRETVTNTIIQDLDEDIGTIGGGSIGVIEDSQRWDVKETFEKYKINNFCQQDLDNGVICLLNQTESITDVIVAAEIPDTEIDSLTIQLQNIPMVLRNAQTDLNKFHGQLFKNINIIGSSTVIRIIPEDNSPIRANSSSLNFKKWNKFNSDLLNQFNYNSESYVSKI